MYLYDHPDFNGVRHLSFGAHDGSALMPVTDLAANSVLTPVSLYLHTTPANTESLIRMAKLKREGADNEVHRALRAQGYLTNSQCPDVIDLVKDVLHGKHE